MRRSVPWPPLPRSAKLAHGTALHREPRGGEAAEGKAAEVDGCARADEHVERAAQRLQQGR
jgi:hypothetical protein